MDLVFKVIRVCVQDVAERERERARERERESATIFYMVP